MRFGPQLFFFAAHERMLPASRRLLTRNNILACRPRLPSTPSPLDALSSQCVNFGRAAFCTTASSSAASSRLKGLKLAEKLEKVERRRARREIKSLREDAKRVESQAFAVEKQSELEAKSRISQVRLIRISLGPR